MEPAVLQKTVTLQGHLDCWSWWDWEAMPSLHVDLHLIKTWLGHLCLGCLAAVRLWFVRSASLSAGWAVCRTMHVFVHTGVDTFTNHNHQWEFPSCEGGISLLGCLSWGSNTPGSVLLWPEQDILKKTWFSWSTIFKFQILNPFLTFVLICSENSFDTFSICQHWTKTFQNVWLVLSLCVTLSFRAWG